MLASCCASCKSEFFSVLHWANFDNLGQLVADLVQTGTFYDSPRDNSSGTFLLTISKAHSHPILGANISSNARGSAICHGLTFACDRNGTYYISVTGIGNATGTFELTARTVGVTATQAIAVEADGASPPDTIVRHPGAAVWFRVEAAAGMTYEVEVQEGTLSDPVLTVVDRDGTTELLRQEKIGHATGLTWACTVSGGYFASVVGRGNATGTFTLAVRTVGVTMTQTILVEADGTPPPGTAVRHDAASVWFRLVAQAGTTYTVEVDLKTLSAPRVALVDTDGQMVDTDSQTSTGLTWKCNMNAAYFVKVSAIADTTGTFELVVRTEGLSASRAIEVKPDGVPPPGTAVRYAGADVWFGLMAEAGTTYEVELILDTLSDSVVSLVDVDGATELLRNDRDNRATPVTGSFLDWTCGVAGMYKIKVSGFGNATGTFELTVRGLTIADPCARAGASLILAGAAGPYALHYDPRLDKTNDNKPSVGEIVCHWKVQCGCGNPALNVTTFMPEAFASVQLFYGRDSYSGVPDKHIKRGSYMRALPNVTTYSAPSGISMMTIQYSGYYGSFAADVTCREQPVLTDRCHSCPSGKIPTEKLGKLICNNCPAAAMCPGGIGDAATQTFCPPGQEPDPKAELQCIACPDGTFSPGKVPCKPCSVVNQKPNANRNECDMVCLPGTYNPYFVNESDTSACVACHAATVCPGGANAAATQTFCPPGQEPGKKRMDCTRCPVGKFRDAILVEQNKSCESCSIPNQEPNVNQTACRCRRNYYNRQKYGFVTCIVGDYKTPTIDEKLPICILCHGKPCLDCDSIDHVLQISPGHARVQNNTQQIDASGATMEVFECPSDSGLFCPQETTGSCDKDAVCHHTTATAGVACETGHTGLLCQVCETDYSRTDKRCVPCSVAKSGATSIVVAAVLLVVALIVLFRSRRMRSTDSATRQLQEQGKLFEHLNPIQEDTAAIWEDMSNEFESVNHSSRPTKERWALLQAAVQPVRILIGFVQIVAQLGHVLHIDLPPLMTKIINFMRPLLADIWGFLVHLDCIGLGDVYSRFVLYVFAMPLCLFMSVIMWYLWQRRHHPADARAQLLSNTFVVIFLCYPTVCHHAFGLFNCRVLSQSLQILADDYSTKCTTPKHKVFQTAAACVIAIFAFGIPLGFTIALVWKTRSFDVAGSTKLVRAAAEQMGITQEEASDIYREVTIGKDYGFLLRAYGPRHYCFENFDMVRKLLLVGVLVIVSRGSVAQVNCAAALSFAFSITHFKMWPYKLSWDNQFKAAIEGQIFVTILVALTLKNDLTGEVAGEQFYDIVLVTMFTINVPIAFVYTLTAKLRHAKRLLHRREKDSTQMAALHHALALHMAGIANEADTQILREFFDSLLLLDLSTLAAQIEGRGGAVVPVILDEESGATLNLNSLEAFCWKPNRTVNESSRGIDEPSVHLAGEGLSHNHHHNRAHRNCEHTKPEHDPGDTLSTTTKSVPADSNTGADLTMGLEPEPEPSNSAHIDYYDKYSTGYIGSFGNAEVFFRGLTGLIGDCRRDVQAAMTAEHCAVFSGFGASDATFITSNYKVETTPRKEWQFVYSPEDLLEPLSAGRTQDTGRALGFRTKQPWQHFLQQAPRLILAKFEEAGLNTVVTQKDFSRLKIRAEEIIGLRLYTGPMFELYNGVLRAWANEQQPGIVPSFAAIGAGLNVCGCFTSTLHSINSGVVKLSQLQPVTHCLSWHFGHEITQAILGSKHSQCTRWC
jgi:hypothetical protein